jgi:hypothetical protein
VPDAFPYLGLMWSIDWAMMILGQVCSSVVIFCCYSHDRCQAISLAPHLRNASNFSVGAVIVCMACIRTMKSAGQDCRQVRPPQLNPNLRVQVLLNRVLPRNRK